LYVVFWTLAAMFVRPAWRPPRVAALVLLATCAVEVLQLCRWPAGFRATLLGGALLGSEFDPWDFAGYAVGAVAAVALSRAAYTGRTNVVEKSTPGSSASTTSSR
jgi:hypothetical protein